MNLIISVLVGLAGAAFIVVLALSIIVMIEYRKWAKRHDVR